MPLENGVLTYETPRHVDKMEDCIFYHVMDLPGYGVTDGPWDLRGRFDSYVSNVDLAGKRVLDIGCASGFLSFEAEKRKAREVVSFDIGHGKYQTLLPFKDKLYYTDHEKWAEERTAHFELWKNGYWMAHRLFQSQAKAFYGNIHALPVELGLFDVVIVGSVLEHLNDQVSALASIARVTGKTMVIVAEILDTDDKIARFEPNACNPDQDYTWWVCSRGFYREVLGMLGFQIDRITTDKYLYTHVEREVDRATLVASRV